MASKASSDKESLTQRLEKLDSLLKKRIDDFIRKDDDIIKQKKQLPVSASDFETKHIISKGQFGELHIVQKKMPKTVYAVKILHKKKILAQNEDVSFLMVELDILAKATSPWITKLHFAFQDAKNLYLVMECHGWGDLRSLLARYKGVLKEDMARFYTGEITLAIHNLHLMGYVHRDLKPESVLLDCRGHVMLAGFTSASKLDQNHLTSSRMTARSPQDLSSYISPELLATNQRQNVIYGAEVDWWSLGVCLYEMLYGKLPFADNFAHDFSTYRSILNHKKCLKFPENASNNPNAMDLIKKLLTDINARLKYDGIQKHPFFESFKWDRVRNETAPCLPRLSSMGYKSNQDIPDTIDSIQTSDDFSGNHVPFYGGLASFRSEESAGCDTKEKIRSTEALKNKCMTLQKNVDSNVVKTKVTVLQPQLEKFEKDLGSGNEKYEKLTVDHSKLQQLSNHQKEECSTSRSEHALMKQKIYDLEKANAEAQRAIMALKMQLKDFQSVKDVELRNLNTSLKAEQEKVKVLERKSMKDEESLEHTFKQKDKEFNSLSLDFRTKEDDLNSTIKVLQTEMHNYNLNDAFWTKSAQEANSMAKLKQEIQEIKSVLEGKEDETRKLHKDTVFLRDSVTNAQRLTELLKSEISEKDLSLEQLRESLEAVKKESKQKIKKVENENQDAEFRMSSICANLGAISSHKKELEGEVERKEAVLKELTDDLNSLREEKKVAEDKILQLENEKQKLALNMNELKVEIHNLKLENESQEQELQEVKSMLEGKYKELDMVQLELCYSRDGLADTQKKLESLQVQLKEISHISEIYEKKQSLLGTTKAKLEETEMAIRHLQNNSETTKFNLETERSQQGKDSKSLQDKINCLLEDVECLNKQLEETQEKYNSVCLKLKESKASCEKCASEKEELEKCLCHKDEEKQDLLKKLDHSNNDIVSLKTEKAELEPRLRQAFFRLETASTGLTDLSEQLEKAENKCTFLNEILDKVRAEKTEHECQVKKLERNVEDLTFSLEESKVHQEKQQHDYIELRTDFQKYKDDANVKSIEETQTKAILNQEVEKLRSIIDGRNEIIGQLNNEMTHTKDAIVKTQSLLDETRSKLEVSEMTLKQAQSDLETTKFNLETEISQQEKENKSQQDKTNCLLGDVECLNKQLEETQEKYNSVCQKMKESKESCEKHASEKEELEKCLCHKDEEKQDLLKKLDHSNNDIVSLKTEKAELEQRLMQAFFKAELTSTDLTDLSEQLEKAENKCKFLNEMLDKVRAEKTEHECQVKKLERNVENLNFSVEESKVHQEKQQHDYSEIQAEFQKYKDDANIKSMEETHIKVILTQEVGELKNMIDRKDEVIGQLNNEMTHKEDSIVKTQSLLDEIRLKFEENEMTLKQVRSEPEATKLNLATEISQQEKKNKSIQDKINSLLGDLECLNEQFEEAQEKYNSVCIKLKESKVSRKKLASEKEELEKCLCHKDEEKEDLLKKLDHSNNDIVSLKTEKAEVEQRLMQALFKLEITATDFTDLSEQLEKAENKCKFLNEMLDKAKAEKIKLDCQVKTLERNVEDLNFSLEESKVHQEKQQHNYSELQADFQKYKDDANVKPMEDIQTKAILNQEVEELKNIINGKDEIIGQLNKKITHIKDDVKEKNIMLETLRGKLNAIEASFKLFERDSGARRLELEEQIVMQKNEIKVLQEKCTNLSFELESLSHFKEDLQDKCEEKNVKLKDIISALEQLTARNELRALQDTLQEFFMKKGQMWEQKEQEFIYSIKKLKLILGHEQQSCELSAIQMKHLKEHFELYKEEIQKPQTWIQDLKDQIQMFRENNGILRHDQRKSQIKEFENVRSSKLTITKWPQSCISFQQGQPAVQQTLSSSSPPVTMDVKTNPQPKVNEAVDLRCLDSGFHAEDISHCMGASFLKAWFRK